MKFGLITINRTIVHKIIRKTNGSPAYSINAETLHTLDADTSTTLLTRIHYAVKKSNRFFETKIQEWGDGSFAALAQESLSAKDSEFVELSKQMADLAAEAHQNINTPGGLLIIVHGEVDKKPAIIVVKAELQEALTLNGSAVELIKELFLSPAKEFYKIGVFVKQGKKNDASSFSSFVYDDNFNPRKDDLAFYFYSSFLGLSTSDNDKLKTNNFLKDYSDFIDNAFKDHHTRKNLKIALKALYRESSKPIIDPRSFIEYFDADPKIVTKYNNEILSKPEYSRSFTKDLTLVDNALKIGKIDITPKIKIVGPSELIDNVDLVDPEDEQEVQKMQAQIDSGQIKKIVTLNEGAILPTFERND